MSRSYVKRKWVVENTWNCDNCGHKNRGRDLRCAKCGSPKDKNQEYDTSNNLTAPAVTDPTLIAMAKDGPNWHCEYCNSDARNSYEECAFCGGPKTTAALNKELDFKVPEEMESGYRDPLPSIDETPVETISSKKQEYDEELESSLKSYESSEKKQQRLIITGVMAGFTLVFMFFWWLFAYHDDHVTVSNTHWEHTAHLEQRYTRNGEGWEDDEPSSHFGDVCETRQHGYHQCNPYSCRPHNVSYSCRCREVSAGESCRTSCSSRSNGFSECQEVCTPRYRTECDTCSRTEYDTCYERCPTYEQWCKYQYYEWREINVQTTQGNDHNLTDPNIHPRTTEHGPQRMHVDREYSVVFSESGGDTFSYDPNTATNYNRFNMGERWLIQVNHAGSVRPVHREY